MTTPPTLHELAEIGQHQQILRRVEREIDIDINAKVSQIVHRCPEEVMQDRFGRTPLQWASEKGHVQTVEALLDMGANLRECDNLGRTAIHLAARSGEAEVLERLLDPIQEEAEVKKMISAADHKGITPVFLAKQRGPEGESAFHLLLKRGAVYNQQTDLKRFSDA